MFASVLIANRGEIVARIARTARRLGVATVAVASDADRGAPFAAACEQVVAIGGELAADSYLRIDAIIEAAKASGAEAVHPGYGFLSERARRTRCVEDLVDAQVGIARVVAADRDGAVARGRERRAAIGIGGDRDGGDAEPLRRPGDPRCDLAAIGDQHRREASQRVGHPSVAKAACACTWR